MWATGLKARFLGTIVVCLSIVVVGTSLLHSEFVKREVLELIDQKLQEVADALAKGGAWESPTIDESQMDKLITERLGHRRIGKFYVVRDVSGKTLFQSNGATAMSLNEIPLEPTWLTIQQNGQFIRIINSPLPGSTGRILQIGFVVSEELMLPQYFSRADLLFAGAILVFGLLAAWVLTTLLMKPISRLSGFITRAAQDSGQKLEIPTLPKDLKQLTARLTSRDEFAVLLSGFEILIDKVNRNSRVSRLWSYQMAHELKTPMALIEAHVEEAHRSGAMQDGTAKAILDEVFEASETISSFLAWAELENMKSQQRLFAEKASNVLRDLQRRYELSFAGRLQMHIAQDFTVMSNLQHLEQAIGNLIFNALIYSPASRPVVVRLNRNSLVIQDFGAGIPASVMQRLGEPFNKGENKTSQGKTNGLGLALVQSIVKLYSWKIDFKTSADGTVVTVGFPDIQSEQVINP